MTDKFSFYSPVRIYYGAGAFDGIGRILGEMGYRRCVVVCGRHFAARAQRMTAELDEVCAAYSGVEPDPKLDGAERAAALARRLDADCIVGVGGGSVMDTAKFAAAIACGGGSADEYYDGRALPERGLAVIAAPTTAGTGSEVTRAAVMSRGGEKRTFFSAGLLPAAAVVDPALSLSVPPRTTMITGLDALTHALEAMWSKNHQPVCDALAEKAVSLILEYLDRAWANGGDIKARSVMSYAALLAGLAFSQTKNAGCHACSYPISERFGLPHGEACALTLPVFAVMNADGRIEEACRRAGIDDSGALARRIDELKALAGLRSRLGALTEPELDNLAGQCLSQPLMALNPVALGHEDIKKMLAALC